MKILNRVNASREFLHIHDQVDRLQHTLRDRAYVQVVEKLEPTFHAQASTFSSASTTFMSHGGALGQAAFVPPMSTWVDVTPGEVVYMRNYPESAMRDLYVQNVAMVNIAPVGKRFYNPFPNERQDGLVDVLHRTGPKLEPEAAE